jgi:uncharacterized Tic20 family protein
MSDIPANPYQQTQPLSPSDEKLWATLIHVGGMVSYFFASLIGYLIFKDRGPFVRDHARIALNFQISLAIYYAAGLLLTLAFIGYLVLLGVVVVNIVFSILAAMAANRGQAFHYPLSIQFIK